MLPPYGWIYGVEEFSGSSKIQRDWKDHQGLIHNTYHGGNIETDHQVICSMPEDTENNFELTNFNTPMTGTMREFLNNGMAPRYQISLNGLVMKKDKTGDLYMMPKTGM